MIDRGRKRRMETVPVDRPQPYEVRWEHGRSTVWAQRGVFGATYSCGRRIDPLPTADEQAFPREDEP